MKILYVGKFTNTYSTENYVTSALTKLGHQVLKIHICKPNFVLSIKEKVEVLKPDFVLFSKVDTDETLHVINYLKAKQILTVCWLWDLYGIPGRYTLPPVFQCDKVFTSDGDLSKFENITDYSVLRQGIHSPESYLLKNNYKYDVAFIGSLIEYRNLGRDSSSHETSPAFLQRHRLISFLSSTYGGRFITRGEAKSQVRGNDLNVLLSKVKIVVGDSYESDNYWSNRIYEITGRGGFLFHPETIGLNEEFISGTHYVAYKRNDFVKLEQKIGYYLSHDSEREQIKLSGFNKTNSEYTYKLRCEELINNI
jgi:hypothetical protein